MRIGQNPVKENNAFVLKSYHRVVVPVFIPNFEGYFSGSFDVFKLCIESLLKTSHDKTRITIYNNNSHSDVKTYIDKIYAESEIIDQVFHSKENMGKINAILAAVKGNIEPLITVTDSDVLFKNDWQAAVEHIFVSFPEAGMVSPVPSSRAFRSHTANNWYYGFFKGKMAFETVEDPEAMHLFDLSLGNNKLLNQPIHLEKYLVITNKENSAKAVMGCGHFVATLKRDVFDKGSDGPAFFKIVGKVESKFIDIPNENLGFLRLASKKNYAYHMGNQTESWMYEVFNNLQKNSYQGIDVTKIVNKRMGRFSRYIGSIFIKSIRNNTIKKMIFKHLGLRKDREIY